MAYKLTTYINENGQLTEDYFADFNDDNGYKKGKYLSPDGTEKLQDKAKYKTADLRDTLQAVVDPDVSTPAVTVVIGPDQQYYAIDGHHGANSYLLTKAFTGSGSDKVNITVVGDYSDLSCAAFWQKMAANNQYYPKAFNLQTHRYQTIDPERLPKQMGSEQFINDPFRSLNYFMRKSVIDKDAISVPFAEFYWGEFLTETKAFDDLDFKDLASYQTALDRANEILAKLIDGDEALQQLFKQTITDQYGIQASQLGLMNKFEPDKIADQKDKLATAWAMVAQQPILQASNTSILDTPPPAEPEKPVITVEKQTIHYLLNQKPTEKDFLQAIGAKAEGAAIQTDLQTVDFSKAATYKVKLEAIDAQGNAADSVPITLVVDSRQPVLTLDNPSLTWKQGKRLTEQALLAAIGIHGENIDHIETDFATSIDPDKAGVQHLQIEAFSETGEHTAKVADIRIEQVNQQVPTVPEKNDHHTDPTVQDPTDEAPSQDDVAGGNSNSPVAKLPATGDKADGAALLGLAFLAAGIYLRGKKQVQ